MVWKLPVWSVFVFGCVSSSLFDKLVMVLFILSRHLVWTINHSMLWMNREFWIFRRAPLHLQGAPLYSPDHLRHSLFLGQSPSFLSLCLQVSLANQSLFLHSASLDCLFSSCSRVAVETYKACVHHMVSTLVSLPVFKVISRTTSSLLQSSARATPPQAGGVCDSWLQTVNFDSHGTFHPHVPRNRWGRFHSVGA